MHPESAMSRIPYKVFQKILALLTVAGLCIASQPVCADSQALMDRMLDTYINVTPDGVFETQRRGGVTFGSVSVRSRIVRPNLVNLEPPSFRGSCAGFDLV